MEHKAVLNAEHNSSQSKQQRLEMLLVQHEDRVSSLEDKLSELSEVTGRYERQHHQDQMSIQKMKDRIAQLDLENTALVKSAPSKPADDEEDDAIDVQEIVDKIVVLKKSLMKANERLEKPMDIEG
jgi:hypothetical protein